MNGNLKTIVIGLVFFLLCGVACYFAGRVKGRRIGWEAGYEAGFAAGYAEPHPADTSATIDTSHYETPEPVDVHPAQPSGSGREKLLLGTIAQLRARLDSLAAAKPDTAFVELQVPIEEKVYEDSTYRAQVSGFRPAIDWIEVYQRTTTITEYLPPKPEPRKVRVSVGVTGGVAVILKDGKAEAGPGAAVGLTLAF